jgi:hypothetical protein
MTRRLSTAELAEIAEVDSDEKPVVNPRAVAWCAGSQRKKPAAAA